MTKNKKMNDENAKKIHKLKSTLAIVMGYIQLVNAGLKKDPENNSKLIELLEKAKKSCKDIEDQIEEIEKNS